MFQNSLNAAVKVYTLAVILNILLHVFKINLK